MTYLTAFLSCAIAFGAWVDHPSPVVLPYAIHKTEVRFPMMAESIPISNFAPDKETSTTNFKGMANQPDIMDVWVDEERSADVYLSARSNYCSAIRWRNLTKIRIATQGQVTESNRCPDHDIVCWRLAKVLERQASNKYIVVDSDPSALKGNVSPQLTFCGVASNAQCHPDQNNAYGRSYSAYYADYDGPKSPLGHIPLSLKIFFLTPLIPLGIWLAWWGAHRFRDWRSPLPSAGMLLLGSTIAGVCLVLVFS
jgi:hypothetical protein